MNKTDFLKLLSNQTDESIKTCHKILTHTRKLINEICFKGEEVRFRGFGKFFLKERPPMRTFNPQTGRYYYSKNKVFVDFAPSKKIAKRR